MSFETVLPHLSSFIQANVTPSSTSARRVEAPVNWPRSLNLDDKVVFINQITGMAPVAVNDMYQTWNITVTTLLYYDPAGRGLDVTAQYDLYHFASDFIQAVFANNRLIVPGETSPAIERAVSVINPVQLPTVLSYPVNDPNAQDYIGALFTLLIPFRINC